MSTGPIELRDRAQAESWLVGGLCLMRLQAPEAAVQLQATSWLAGMLSDFGALPPPGVLADIGHLMTGASMRNLQPMPVLSGDLARVVHSYEDHVLGRLDADPRLDTIVDAIATMDADRRDRAVALFVAHLARRMGYRAAVAISPGAIREVGRLTNDEFLAAGQAALAPDTPATGALISGYEDLIARARRMGSLITEAEVFLIENLDVLSDLGQRVAIGQIIEIADALATAMPRRLKPNNRAQPARIHTSLASEDNYPTGGFSALSTSGSMENLVISELIYMEDDDSVEIDLFDLRYAEGELLYYTRDDSVFVRNHREILFVLPADLIRARFKDPELSWQRLVIVLGLINCCVRRLVEWLADEGLRIRLLFVVDGRSPGAESEREHALATEERLASLSLREWISKEVVDIGQVDSVSAALASAGERARSMRTDLVLVTTEPASPPVPNGVFLVTLNVGDAEPVLALGSDDRASACRVGDADEPGRLWPAWVDTTLGLLQALL